jgi:hypothetical protein
MLKIEIKSLRFTSPTMMHAIYCPEKSSLKTLQSNFSPYYFTENEISKEHVKRFGLTIWTLEFEIRTRNTRDFVFRKAPKSHIYIYIYLLLIRHVCVLILQRFRFFVKIFRANITHRIELFIK